MNDDDKTITLDGGLVIPFIDRKPTTYFRKTTILYGPSETGKSVIIKWIMYILRMIIPNVIVINPTSDANNAWEGMIPSRCIKTVVQPQDLYDIYERQKTAVSVYNKASKIEILESLVAKINDAFTLSTASAIKSKLQEAVVRINESSIDYAEKKAMEDELRDKAKNKLVITYKQCIKLNKSRLSGVRLSEDELYSIKYLNFNPSILLIMDDCGAQIELWGKDPIINELFFNGRHWWVTSIYTMQDDKKLPTGIRKNTFNAFFTDPNCAISYFKNSANSFTNETKRNAQRLIDWVFKQSANGTKNNKKMVYSRLDPVAPLRWILADMYPPFRFGSPELWKMCGRVKSDKKKDQMDKKSKFYTSFAL